MTLEEKDAPVTSEIEGIISPLYSRRRKYPEKKASNEELEEQYKQVAKAGQPLPPEFYKFKSKSGLKWVIHEHRPGKKVRETSGRSEETKVPVHGETGFKKIDVINEIASNGVTIDGVIFKDEPMNLGFILKFRDHLDFRFEIQEDNVKWIGFTPHPAQEPSVWDVFKQRIKNNKQVQCSAKSPCTHDKCMDWMNLGDGGWDKIPAGEPGASTIRTGELLIRDKGTIEYGVQRDNLHEYFLSGRTIKGRVVFRRLDIGGSRNWYFVFPDDQMPLKPWEHEDSGQWRIKGVQAPVKKAWTESARRAALEARRRKARLRSKMKEYKLTSMIRGKEKSIPFRYNPRSAGLARTVKREYVELPERARRNITGIDIDDTRIAIGRDMVSSLQEKEYPADLLDEPVSASYDSESGLISMYKWSDPKSFLHESGHAHSKDFSSWEWSAWQDVVEEEPKMPSSYAKVNIVESYAECFADHRMDPEEFKESFPKKAKFLEEMTKGG